jgi:hypothetical protein
VVLCGLALAIMPGMVAVLRELLRVLVPGGFVGVSSFGSEFLQPLRNLWTARLGRYGETVPRLPTERLGDRASGEVVLHEAGFTVIDVPVEQMGCKVPDVEARWADNIAGLEGKWLLHLPSEQRKQVRAEHLPELETYITADGHWLDVPAVFALGLRPA